MKTKTLAQRITARIVNQSIKRARMIRAGKVTQKGGRWITDRRGLPLFCC